MHTEIPFSYQGSYANILIKQKCQNEKRKKKKENLLLLVSYEINAFIIFLPALEPI